MDKVEPKPIMTKNSKNVPDNLINFLHNNFSNSESIFLCNQILDRMNFGIKKYGTALHSFNGRDAVNDANQELIDAIQYIFQAHLENKDLSEFYELLKLILKIVEILQKTT